jgi:hypothetical protein
MQAIAATTVELARDRARAGTRRACFWLLGAYLLSFQLGVQFAWQAGQNPSSRGTQPSVALGAQPLPANLRWGAEF